MVVRMTENTWMFVMFALGTGVILVAGSRLARVADELADRTGMGEAVTGALLLGAVTSLPGLMASALAASRGLPELAASNAIGGIAAQTLFLVFADFFHKPANLEHAAASGTNLFQGSLLIVLLAAPLAAANGPDINVVGVHPVSLLMFIIYLGGQRIAARVRREGMWIPKDTKETSEDEPDDGNNAKPLGRMLFGFLVLGFLTAAAGWMVGDAGISLVEKLGWKQGVVGGLLTAISSSLPELVTTIACVRRGAYTLAVSGIVGGNAFDTLFLAVSDGFYTEGSIYHAMSSRQEFFLVISIMMSAILVAGLIRRERSGPANVGLEGVLLILCYGLAVVVMSTG